MAQRHATLIKLSDKSLLFYSTFDPISRRIIHEVHKDPTIKALFEYIQLNTETGQLDPRLPKQIIQQIQKNPRGIPILVIPGFGHNYLFGLDVVMWIENNIFHGHGGAVFADLFNQVGAAKLTQVDRDAGVVRDDDLPDHDDDFLLIGKTGHEVVDTSDTLGGVDAWTENKFQTIYRDTESKKEFSAKITRAIQEIKHNRYQQSVDRPAAPAPPVIMAAPPAPPPRFAPRPIYALPYAPGGLPRPPTFHHNLPRAPRW